MTLPDQHLGNVPLTWAQQQWMAGPPPQGETDIWRYEMSLPVEVPPGVTVPDAVAAATSLLRRYPPLRSRLHRHSEGHLYQQILAPDDPVLLRGMERLAVVSFDSARQSLIELGRRVNKVVADPSAGNVMVILPPAMAGGRGEIATSHAHLDADGTHVLADSFLSALRSGGDGAVQRTLYETLDFERSERGAELSARNIRYLVSMARRAEERGQVDHPMASYSAEVEGCRVRSRWLLRELSRSVPDSRLSRAALMYALSLIAVCSLRDTDGAWAATLVGNRTTSESRSFVGLAMQCGTLTETISPSESVQQLRSRVALRLAQCLRHGRFDPHNAQRELDRAGIMSKPMFAFNHWESPATDWDAPRANGEGPRNLEPESHEWGGMPAPAAALGAAIDINSSVILDHVLLRVKWNSAFYSRLDIERFIAHIERMVPVATDNPEVTVAKLRSLMPF